VTLTGFIVAAATRSRCCSCGLRLRHKWVCQCGLSHRQNVKWSQYFWYNTTELGLTLDFSDVINPFDEEKLSSQFSNTHPFPWIVLDNFLQREFAEIAAQSYPTYSAAQKNNKSFQAVNESRTVQITKFADFPEPIQRLSSSINSEEFLKRISILTGIEGLTDFGRDSEFPAQIDHSYSDTASRNGRGSA
jgi:hypothetical protein